MDLTDVIMLAQRLSEDGPASAKASLRELVSSMQIVAGMKTVIRSADDDAKTTAMVGTGYLIPTSPTVLEPHIGPGISSVHLSFKPHAGSPPDPPPPQMVPSVSVI